MAKKIFHFKTLIILAAGLAGALLVLYAWRLPPFDSGVEVTENAYIRGRVTLLAPQLSGYVTDIAVRDFETVRAGQVLVRIDDRIYARRLEQAEAELAGRQAALANADQDRLAAEARIASAKAAVDSAQAALTRSRADAGRVDALISRGAATRAAADAAHAARDQAAAALTQAEAAVEVAKQDLQSVIVGRGTLDAAVEAARAAVRLARIDLDNTRITAPVDGRMGEIGVRLGQYVTAGTQLAAIVPADRWIIANFKETQLSGMRPGQPVSFTVDALPGQSFRGRIERFSPATGSEFAVLKPDNATGNFTKVAQRLPVRIAIDHDQPALDGLAPGLSVVVRVDTEGGAGRG
ncbi:HlyD family secretion protein [uncultured Tistrella sp.]|uniref:HlyD family secretion protein n=1 Tax=Tistrella mobilis TaxID=171437 RepID=UPI000C090F3B|nr:HlyD family secretion protein [uncultured Tistrella sp.]MAM73232.1 hemolysin secretion protein D [Tistrella sp.]